MAANEPRKKARVDSVGLGSVFSSVWRETKFDDAVVTNLAQAFATRTAFDSPQACVEGQPFGTCLLRNVFDPAFLENVKRDFLKEPFEKKSNDLYDFEQTSDMKAANSSALRDLRNAIYSEAFVNLVATIARVNLNQQIDMSGHRYSNGAHLLCHDDELEGRQIAYIIYLVSQDWKFEDGGRLELFDTDANNQPQTVVRHIVPEWNCVVFFEVTPESYHQVSEVFAENKHRLSFSGWFHKANQDGETVQKLPYHEPPLPRAFLSNPNDDELNFESLGEWINKEYLTHAAISKIQTTFVEKSSIELHKFLRSERYQELYQAFSILQNSKDLAGPANRRQYWRIRTNDDHDNALARFLQFAKSSEFVGYLQRIVSLRLKSVQCEVRQFDASHYTLLHDHAVESPGLDVVLSCIEAGHNWRIEHGGATVYIAEGEDEELLTVAPHANSLLLVLRDEGVLRFVKYLNHHTQQPRRDISLVYFES